MKTSLGRSSPRPHLPLRPNFLNRCYPLRSFIRLIFSSLIQGDTTRSPQLLPRPAPDLPEPNDSPPMGPIPTSPIPDAAATTSTRQNSKPGTSLVIPETPLSSRRGGRLASPDLGGTSSLAAEYTSPSEGVGSGEGEQWWSPGRDSREHTPQVPSERSHLGGLQTLPTVSNSLELLWSQDGI